MSGTWATLAFFLVGAIPLLPLCLRPLEKRRTSWVRGIGRLLAWGLLWLAFNSSLMTIWGAVRFVPEWWAFVIGMPLLQIPAAWFSYRVVYADEDET
jgi:hypothetical protein